MRRFLMFLCVSIIMVTSCFAGSYSAINFSDLKTEDALIHTGKGMFNALTITGDGATSCSVRLYNKTTSTGATIWKHTVSANTSDTVGVVLPFPVPFDLGIYADMETTGTCSYEIYYQQYIP